MYTVVSLIISFLVFLLFLNCKIKEYILDGHKPEYAFRLLKVLIPFKIKYVYSYIGFNSNMNFFLI